MGRKILLTGSCGFLMGNYIRNAIYEHKNRDTYISIDRVNNSNSAYWNRNHIFYPADICDQHIVDFIFATNQPEIVIHAADQSLDNLSSDSISKTLQTNVLGTQNIINSCVKHQVKRLIYVSDVMVNLEQVNPYIASKKAGELLIQSANYTSGLDYNIVRTSNIYGRYQPSSRLIPKTLKCIKENQKIPLYYQGAQTRDWLHVRDYYTALSLIVDRGQANSIYSMASRQEFNNLEVVQMVCNAMGNGHQLMTFVDDPNPWQHPAAIISSNQEIEKLGWKPQVKIKDGISDAVQWYNDNYWFLR